METVMLIDNLATMISYFEESIREEDTEALRNCGAAMVVIDRDDVEALQIMAKLLWIIENNPKIKKLVMDKYVDL